MDWTEAERLHASAASSLIASASRVPATLWRSPPADGKWSPAEIVEHLTIAYDVLLRELAGGAGMEIRTRLWQRILLRLTVAPKIMRGQGFPEGVSAPRELRPQMPAHSQHEAIVRFDERARAFQTAAANARGSRVRLTHPYFGRSPIEKTLAFCARHIEHHRGQLDPHG